MQDIQRARARIYASEVSSTAKLVALFILDCQGGCPSGPEIASACSLVVRTVRRALRELEAGGLLLTRRSIGKVNDYQVLWS